MAALAALSHQNGGRLQCGVQQRMRRFHKGTFKIALWDQNIRISNKMHMELIGVPVLPFFWGGQTDLVKELVRVMLTAYATVYPILAMLIAMFLARHVLYR